MVVMTDTYIVAGSPYSGTSLIAGTLHVLGVPMGEKWRKDGTYEDVEFIKNVKDEKSMYDIIWARNQKFDKWGFKYPLAWKYIWTLTPSIKNPHIIYAYRNVVNWQKKHPTSSVFRHLKTQGFWGAYLEVYRFPTLFIDYDEAISNPQKLVKELVKFCKLSPTKAQLERAINFNTKGTGYNTEG